MGVYFLAGAPDTVVLHVGDAAGLQDFENGLRDAPGALENGGVIGI